MDWFKLGYAFAWWGISAVWCVSPAAEQKTVTNSIGMKLVEIPAGKFQMGNGQIAPVDRADWATRDHDESPAHMVTISKSFLMGATEVTNAQFEQFDPDHRKWRGKRGVSKGDNEPVTFVTWDEAIAFCAWLSKKEGKPYRLPTEAEWEYACRAGTTTTYHTGDTISDMHANLGATKSTVEVGKFPANAFGLHDMHGNVMEWCHDWYGPYYEAHAQTDLVGRADGDARVARGWCFHQPARSFPAARYARSANRSGFLPHDANMQTGFRVVQGELPATKPVPREVLPYQVNVVQEKKNPKELPSTNYINYLAEKKNPKLPPNMFGPIFSNHNHYGAVTVCPNGDVLMAWYTTVGEPGREMTLACSRLRAGSDTWDPACLFFDIPDVNDHAPVLLTHGKRIYHFCTQSLIGWDYATDIVRWSEDNGVTWSKPIAMVTRDAVMPLSQPCSALVAKDGTIVVACDGDVHKDERLIVSKDNGKTWQVQAGDMRKTAGSYAIHPAIAELNDGRIINFLRGPNPMPVQYSSDLGATWQQENSPFPGISSGMKASAMRLNSGNLLLISIDTAGKFVGKNKTFAALSKDDGKTWPHIRQLDGVGGYMAACQAENSTIYVAGSRMGVVAFNEKWLTGK
ncbi:MAG: SUMF1/EgtB/PvdO family nonheme iron enzyme [Zavarzinella sp.]